METSQFSKCNAQSQTKTISSKVMLYLMRKAQEEKVLKWIKISSSTLTMGTRMAALITVAAKTEAALCVSLRVSQQEN